MLDFISYFFPHEKTGLAGMSGSDRGRAFIAVLACVLSRLVEQNDSVRGHCNHSGCPLPFPHLSLVSLHPFPGALQKPASSKDVVTKFHALRPPTISIRDYLER